MQPGTETQDDDLAMAVAKPPYIDTEIKTKSIAPNLKNGRFAVHAHYWMSGLHNKQGLELAEEINKQITASKLQQNEEAIKQLLLAYSSAKQLGLSVVDEQIYLDDEWRELNLAEPTHLLDGVFVRDKDGAYRPAAGGRAVLLDQGDTLKLKGGEQNLEVAVALAHAKGWTAMSLTGSSKMIEAAWIAAQLNNPTIQITNYTPTKEAQAKLAARLAQQCVTSGVYEGKVLSADDKQVVQKIGRDPDVFVRHDIKNLSRIPAKDEVVGIQYQDGKGQVSGKENQLEKTGNAR